MSVLSREGCIVNIDTLTQSHIDELTVSKAASVYYPEVQQFEVFLQREDGKVIVPRYWGKCNIGITCKSFGHVYSASRLVFQGSLRSDLQQAAASKSVEQLKYRGGGVMCIATGIGKTVIALHVACTLRLKTLVVVHKQFLLDQWTDRINQFVPLARIGRLQQNTVDTKGRDIIVGMLQSIAMHEYDPTIFDGIGLVIFDEVHVVPTPVFSRALIKLSVPYFLGLSATPERRDGLSRVIHWFIGPTFFQHYLRDRKEVTVRVVPFNVRGLRPPKKAGVINVMAVTTILSKIRSRNALLVDAVCTLVKDGHKVMLLSDRRLHCETLVGQLRLLDVQSALYIGGMKTHELARSIKSNVLLSTFAMAKEGLDIPALDALVLASPRSDVVQACGRILHGANEVSRLPPVIVDVVDQWHIGHAQFDKRKAYYDHAGFTICW
jgi:superfamily II DNA or RNA helicase